MVRRWRCCYLAVRPRKAKDRETLWQLYMDIVQFTKFMKMEIPLVNMAPFSHSYQSHFLTCDNWHDTVYLSEPDGTSACGSCAMEHKWAVLLKCLLRIPCSTCSCICVSGEEWKGPLPSKAKLWPEPLSVRSRSSDSVEMCVVHRYGDCLMIVYGQWCGLRLNTNLITEYW